MTEVCFERHGGAYSFRFKGHADSARVCAAVSAVCIGLTCFAADRSNGIIPVRIFESDGLYEAVLYAEGKRDNNTLCGITRFIKGLMTYLTEVYPGEITLKGGEKYGKHRNNRRNPSARNR